MSGPRPTTTSTARLPICRILPGDAHVATLIDMPGTAIVRTRRVFVGSAAAGKVEVVAGRMCDGQRVCLHRRTDLHDGLPRGGRRRRGGDSSKYDVDEPRMQDGEASI